MIQGGASLPDRGVKSAGTECRGVQPAQQDTPLAAYRALSRASLAHPSSPSAMTIHILLPLQSPHSPTLPGPCTPGRQSQRRASFLLCSQGRCSLVGSGPKEVA